MTLRLDVKGVSQDLDFDTGAMANFVILELPDGKAFRAAVEDDVAQIIISAATNGSEQQSEQSMQELYDEQLPGMQAEWNQLKDAEQQMRQGLDGDEAVMEFGGDVGEPNYAKLSPEQIMKGKKVPSHFLDEMGNLTKVPGGGVDPGEVVSDDDEDGTESI